ncbi:hypothetical protein YC2023_073583 [Brassica napus]
MSGNGDKVTVTTNNKWLDASYMCIFALRSVGFVIKILMWSNLEKIQLVPMTVHRNLAGDPAEASKKTGDHPIGHTLADFSVLASPKIPQDNHFSPVLESMIFLSLIGPLTQAVNIRRYRLEICLCVAWKWRVNDKQGHVFSKIFGSIAILCLTPINDNNKYLHRRINLRGLYGDWYNRCKTQLVYKRLGYTVRSLRFQSDFFGKSFFYHKNFTPQLHLSKMDRDLWKAMQNLNIGSNLQPLRLSRDTQRRSATANRLSLVVRGLNPAHQNLTGMRNTLPKAWRLHD